MTTPLPGTIGSNLPRVVSGVTSGDTLFGIQGGTTKQFPIPSIVISTIVGSTLVTTAGDYDIQYGDQIVYLQGAYTRNVNLLAAADVRGNLLWIKVDANGATNTQTIVPADGDLIEGLDSLSLNGPYQWVLLYPITAGLWLLFT